VEHNNEVQACFTKLAELMSAQYGEPTRKLGQEGSRLYYWEKIPGPGPQDKIDLMLEEHFAEGGLTEGSVQVRFVNSSLENSLYHEIMGRTVPGSRKSNPPAGFCGIPWGSSPEDVPGAMLDETLAEVLRIYTGDVDVTPLLGDVKQVKKAWLVFDKTRGLQRGVISFDGREYTKVFKHLTGLFGNPRWEKDSPYWQLADDLRLELEVMEAFGMLHGTLHVQNPGFIPYERQLFGNSGGRSIN
jgi:hypothetical protein